MWEAMWIDYGLTLVIIGLILGLMRMVFDMQTCTKRQWRVVRALEARCEALAECYAALSTAFLSHQGVSRDEHEALAQRTAEAEEAAAKAFNQAQKALSKRGVESRAIQRAEKVELEATAGDLLKLADMTIAGPETPALAKLAWLAMTPRKKLGVLRDIAEQKGLEYAALNAMDAEKAQGLVVMLNERYDDILFPDSIPEALPTE